MYKKCATQLIKVLGECTCSFTTVLYGMEALKNAGFRELALSDMNNWELQNGDKVFVNVYDSSLFAFTIGENYDGNGMLRLVASHTDSPALYIKPSPEMKCKKYGKLNVEVYGGPILNTWLDRPLSVAGKLAIRGKSVFEPEVVVVDFKKNLLTIPNLAIHLNREINKGIELNRQRDMAPLCAIVDEELSRDDFFMEYLAKELDVEKNDILDFELYVYNAEEGCTIGIGDEILQAPRLDNITSVKASLDGIIKAQRNDGINAIMLYDNEEIGSRSKQGADSSLFLLVIEKINAALGYGRGKTLSAITNGFMISLDVAHAMHPNHIEKADVTNINIMNDGIVIKRASSQSYGTDCESIAIIEQLCEINNIPYQKFESRSDATTGSTLGNIAGKYIPSRVVDIGVPILAMHSARETMGIKDQYYMEQLILDFFSVN